MLAAIDVPQSKSVTIAFLALKTTILILIITSTSKSMAHRQYQYTSIIQNQSNKIQLLKPCTSKMVSFASIVQIFNLLGCILDIFCLIYFFCQPSFRCMQYYVFFGYHIVLMFVGVIGSITARNSSQSCEFQDQFLLTVSISSVVFFLSSIIVMWSNLYFALKYAHFGSNVTWFIIWMVGGSCESNVVMLVALIHGVLSVAGIGLFLVNRFMKKTILTAKIWKAFTFISLIAMVFCYIVVLLGLLAGTSCQSAQFFKKNYQIYGIIQIIGPILILMFLRSQQGDPRKRIINNHEQIFGKLQQHQNIDLNQKQ